MTKQLDGLSVSERRWLKLFGQHVEKTILTHGYGSIYEFWIEKCDQNLSRATINNLVTGKKDFRLTTIRKLARLLGIKAKSLLDFE